MVAVLSCLRIVVLCAHTLLLISTLIRSCIDETSQDAVLYSNTQFLWIYLLSCLNRICSYIQPCGSPGVLEKFCTNEQSIGPAPLSFWSHGSPVKDYGDYCTMWIWLQMILLLVLLMLLIWPDVCALSCDLVCMKAHRFSLRPNRHADRT